MEKKKEFKPFIPADKVLPEFTAVSIALGIILAVVFGAANAYLGLRVGMTVSASIPAAVISMGVIRVILKRDSILENNMVQTIGSAGESLAAGAIFTLPAMFMWMEEWGQGMPNLLSISAIAFCGGALGVLFMIPLRKALIVNEHGTLPYPEGTACAEVLLAGEEGGAKASIVFKGLGIAALYKFVADGVKLFPSEVHYEIATPQYKGTGIGGDVLPALLGVGYICGPQISGYMLAGAVLGWGMIMPLISFFGGDAVIYPGTDPISTLESWDIWSKYIRYVGAGAVATGGIMSLIKSMPLIVRTFRDAIKDYSNKDFGNRIIRTDRDLSMKIILIGVVALVIFIDILPSIPVNFVSALIIAVFGFFFATVSARLVGLVGSSNNPVSGMAIATLLISTFILKKTGMIGQEGMLGAIAIGSIICIIAAIAGDTSQDLKTGYIVGATPEKQQIGEIIGVVASALAIGGVLWLLSVSFGYGSKELPAPQAILMKLVVEGVMGGDLPWTLVFGGAAIAIGVEILGIPVLPFAVGLYLPIHLSTPIMVGGLVRYMIEKKKSFSEEQRKSAVENGILYTSGLIAGEGIIGILLAVFAIIPAGPEKTWGDVINIGANLNMGEFGNILALAVFAVLTFSLIRISKPQKVKK